MRDVLLRVTDSDVELMARAGVLDLDAMLWLGISRKRPFQGVLDVMAA